MGGSVSRYAADQSPNRGKSGTFGRHGFSGGRPPVRMDMGWLLAGGSAPGTIPLDAARMPDCLVSSVPVDGRRPHTDTTT
jgi:hypothetical protein